MIKLLILTSSFAMGGTEAALNSLLHKLDEKKYDVTVLSITREGPMMEGVPAYVSLKQLKFSDPKYRIFVSGRKEKTESLKTFLAKLQKRFWYLKYKETAENNQLYEKLLDCTETETEEYDLLLDFHGYGYFLTAYGAKKIKAKKKAMWIHDENVWWIYKIASYLPEYDKIFCVSKAVMASFLKQFPQYEKRTQVFYNLTDTKRILQRAEELLNDNRYIGEEKLLTIGRMEEQKGYDIALTAAEILKHRNVRFQWFFMGDGNLRGQIQKEIRNKNLEDCVKMLGRCRNPYPYIKGCTIYIQPSRHEGYATTILEAKVLEKPIIASNIPSNSEQIQNGSNGFLVNLNGESFADKIQQLLTDKNIMEKITENLKKESIDFSDEIHKLENLLEE